MQLLSGLPFAVNSNFHFISHFPFSLYPFTFSPLVLVPSSYMPARK
jgi:hypothetical protein